MGWLVGKPEVIPRPDFYDGQVINALLRWGQIVGNVPTNRSPKFFGIYGLGN